MTHHRQSVLSFCADPATQPQFLRFANAVSNDLTFHMAEAFKHLTSIRETEKEQDNAAAWAALPAETRAEKESLLRTDYNAGRHYLARLLQQVCLMALVTEHTAQVWLCKDLRGRLTSSLGYFLDQLVGKSRANLRVKDSELASVSGVQLQHLSVRPPPLVSAQAGLQAPRGAPAHGDGVREPRRRRPCSRSRCRGAPGAQEHVHAG